MKLNSCKSCGSPAKHTKTGVVNRIQCTKCFCRIVVQDLDKAIRLWNGEPVNEDHANIKCDRDLIETEIIRMGKSTGFSMDNIGKILKK